MSQIRTILVALFVVFLVNMFAGLQAQAQSRGGGGGGGGSGSFDFTQRAERREASRWTLSEWLEQRDRNRMMDLWLSMNSPSPFEVMLGVSSISYKTTIDTPASETSYQSSMGELRAYAQFVGLTMEYENNTQEHHNDVAGMLNIRLLGDSLQNSHLSIHVGQRVRTLSATGTDNIQRNILTQASLQLYFAKYFGLDGHYRQYQPQGNDTLGETIGGTQMEAGLFIDFKSVRVFGAWYQDVQTNENNQTHAETKTRREGIKSGLKIFY